MQFTKIYYNDVSGFKSSLLPKTQMQYTQLDKWNWMKLLIRNYLQQKKKHQTS